MKSPTWWFNQYSENYKSDFLLCFRMCLCEFLFQMYFQSHHYMQTIHTVLEVCYLLAHMLVFLLWTVFYTLILISFQMSPRRPGLATSWSTCPCQRSSTCWPRLPTWRVPGTTRRPTLLSSSPLKSMRWGLCLNCVAHNHPGLGRISQFGLSHLFVLEMPPFYVSPECIQAETTSALFLSFYNCLLIVLFYAIFL